MASVAVQAGHCFRSSGSTGAAGEQAFADRVSRMAVSELQRRGHDAVRVLADGVNYRAWDCFVAVHYDSHGNSSVRGASVGYRNNVPSREFAQTWKRTYRRAGFPGDFRGDNYTRALAGYYGNRRAQNAGTHAAIICEFGFGSNPRERRWMDGNPDECAQSIADAVDITVGAGVPSGPRPVSDDEQEDSVKHGQVSEAIRQLQHALNRYIELTTARGHAVLEGGGHVWDEESGASHLRVDGQYGDRTRWFVHHAVRRLEETLDYRLYHPGDEVVTWFTMAALERGIGVELARARGQE